MSLYDKNELHINCPVCNKEMKVRYSDVYNSKKAQCKNYSCKAEIHFDYSSANNFKNALKDLERAQDKVEKAEKEIMNKIEIKMKK